MSSASPHRIDPPSSAVPGISPHVAGQVHRPATALRHFAEGGSAETGSTEIDSAETTGRGHRIDSPHTRSPGHETDPNDVESSTELLSREQWLHLHATDLIDRLQAWEADLDAREAQLNARSSLEDHRERRFRLQQQDMATELAEKQQSTDRLRREIEVQARRLAFLSESAIDPPNS